MPNSKRGNLAFFQYMQVWRRYNGYAYGDYASPASIPNNTTTHAYLVRNVSSADAPQVTRTMATFAGASFNGAMIGGVQNYGSFNVGLPELDGDLIDLVTNSLVDATTMTNWRIFSNNNNLADLPQVGMSLHYKFQSRESGTDGEQLWANLVYPAGNMYPLPPVSNNAGGLNPMANPFTFVPTKVSKFPNGVSFGANQGWASNQTEAFWIITEKPLALTTYISDASTVNVQLAYLPSFSATTATYNNSTRNGATTAPTSITPATGVVVMAAAGTAADLNHFWYMTDFVAAS